MEGRLDLLSERVELLLAHYARLPDFAHDGPLVPYRLYNITGACLTLRTDERSTLRNPTERFTQVSCTAHKGNLEGMLVDMMFFVCGRQDLGLVDVVNANSLENLFIPESPSFVA